MTSCARSNAGWSTEAALLVAGVRLLKRRWPVVAVGQEVRSHGRCRTDACALIRQNGGHEALLVGVEAKLFDWSRAIAQAAMNRYAVDASFISVPTGRISDALLHEAERHGVGVLAVSTRALEVALAGVVGEPDPVLRVRVLGQLDKSRPRGGDPVRLLTVSRSGSPLVQRGAA